MNTIDGIYVGYFTGADGHGLAMFVFNEGTITGADFSGVLFDGHFDLDNDAIYRGKVTVIAPPNGTLVQGIHTGNEGLSYEVDLELPVDFAVRDYLNLNTPLGAVNLKLTKLRDIQ